MTQWSICNLFFIYYISPFVSKALDFPVTTYDCKTRKEVLTIPYLIFTASDNPMHAEQTSGSGLNSNYFCHTCDVGGTKAYKKSDEGFAKVFEVSLYSYS
jgi:hypothetical protein